MAASSCPLTCSHPRVVIPYRATLILDGKVDVPSPSAGSQEEHHPHQSDSTITTLPTATRKTSRSQSNAPDPARVRTPPKTTLARIYHTAKRPPRASSLKPVTLSPQTSLASSECSMSPDRLPNKFPIFTPTPKSKPLKQLLPDTEKHEIAFPMPRVNNEKIPLLPRGAAFLSRGEAIPKLQDVQSIEFDPREPQSMQSLPIEYRAKGWSEYVVEASSDPTEEAEDQECEDEEDEDERMDDDDGDEETRSETDDEFDWSTEYSQNCVALFMAQKAAEYDAEYKRKWDHYDRQEKRRLRRGIGPPELHRHPYIEETMWKRHSISSADSEDSE